jgi:hypothetical protein
MMLALHLLVALPMYHAVPYIQTWVVANDEYHKDDCDIVKAAHAIDEALKLELKHHKPLPTRSLRGSI